MATRIYGLTKTPLNDVYHAILRARWSVTFGVIAAAFLAINVLFAIAYRVVGGTGADDLAHAFYFSVQTMGTIGYGVLNPQTTAANVLVVVESIVSLILTAVATGMVFAKFSRPTARVMFSKYIAIAPMDGVPTLSFRIGNLRSNQIVDAQIRVSIIRTEVTAEGKTFYRMLDLQLTRDRALSLSRAWVVLHQIDEKSPLFNATEETLKQWDAEIDVLVVGIDDTHMQAVHAVHRYDYPEVKFGMRLADILSEEGGDFIVDLRKFHELEPV
jgi:inward rectifier potassium channel